MNNEKKQGREEAVAVHNTAYLTDEVITNMKSVVHLFNAKPDTTIKLFNKSRVITYEDIVQLNDKLQAKFRNHHVDSLGSLIRVNLTKSTSKEFGNWSEFSRTDWQISHRTSSISIQWDIMLTLPHYQFPQRHTIKVRIGSHLKPEEVFKLVMESENESEILQSVSDIVCKIDFVNDIFCDEVLGIIENWYEALAKDSTATRTGAFIKKHSEKISSLISKSLPFLAILLIFIFTYSLLDTKATTNIDLTAYHLKVLLIWTLCSIITYKICEYIGKRLAELSLKKAKKINNAPLIIVTKGDRNYLEKTEKQNNKLVKEFIINLIISTIGPIATFIYGVIKGLFF